MTSREKSHSSSSLIVGLGASAGGLEAFKQLLPLLPGNAGMTFLVVQHLDPKHKSMLTELLAPHTCMPVTDADHNTLLKPNAIYVIRPDTALAVRNGRIELTPPELRRGVRLSVDHLFHSLAREYGVNAAGIVLSGAGSDGSAGLREIKTAGGLVIAQDPDSCAQTGMPRSAIDTGVVDLVLPIQDMPQALLRFARLPSFARVEPVDDRQVREGLGGDRGSIARLSEAQVDRLAAVLEAGADFDVRAYKIGTLQRRVSRRMALAGLDEVGDYIEHVREDSGEQQALMRDLLISVTDFFRDADAFAALRGAVIEPLVREAQPHDTLRCWVPGCATGEEAYSLAMEFLDAIEAQSKRLNVQIFATDLDRDALGVARSGFYRSCIEEYVGKERLERYFKNVDGRGYRVRPRLRDTLSFAEHDLTRDAPFSRMALVSCRNVLIYLRPEMQRQVLKAIHFALDPGSCLFLGTSESVGQNRELFSTVSKKWRIYRKLGVSKTFSIAHDRAAGRREIGAQPPAANERPPRARRARDGDDLARRTVMNLRVAPSIVVAEDGAILYMHGELRPFLQFPVGDQPRLELSALVTPELATRTQAALYKCRRRGETVEALSRGEGPVPRTRIVATPVFEIAEGAVLITFEGCAQGDDPARTANDTADAAPTVLVEELERENAAIREDLRNTVEELESSNEELRSSNEEAMSMNEELQSSNEELEATTEELRSLNEELTTVNAQLRDKIQQVEQAHDDLSNFVASTRIATLFLSDQLCVKRFTPAAAQLLGLGHDDIGRYVGDIARELLQHDLVDEARGVLQDLAICSRVVPTKEGRCINRSILPYRTESRRIDGVVVTLLDVTEMKNAYEAKRKLAAIVECSDDAIIGESLDGVVTSWNKGAQRLFGYSAEEMVGQSVARLAPPDRQDEMLGMLDRLRRGEPIEHFETQRRAKDGRLIDVSLSISPILDDEGQVSGASKVARDITSRKRAEQALRASEERYRALVETQTEMVCRFRGDGTIEFANSAYARARGTSAEKLVGANLWTFVAGEDRDSVKEMLSSITPQNPELRIENRFQTGDGVRWFLWTNRGLAFDADGRLTEAQSTGIDITERKAMEQKLRDMDERKDEFLAILGHELRNPLAPLFTGLELARHSEQDLQALRKAHEMMGRQLGHLRHLVDDLLDVSRISRGNVELRRARIDLNIVLAAAVELAEGVIGARGHVLKVSPAEVPVPIDGDQERLTQVVGNLLNNAAKYTEPGGRIDAGVAVEQGRAVVRVSDTGLGFPPERSSALFEMFFHLPEHRRYTGGGGMGVGLALGRQLAELHGGTLEASSPGFGQGSAFELRLPLAAPTREAPASAPAPATQNEAPRRVLVVDDNVDAAQAVRLALELRGHTVHEVYDGLGALDAVDSFLPDIVLLDIGLPHMDGYEVAKRIRATTHGASMRLYALSGWGQRQDRLRAERAGFDEHLTKPVETERLYALVAAAPANGEKRFDA